MDKLHPLYHLYLEQNNQFLLSARKRKKSKTSNYLISLDKGDMSRTSPNYVGKVRSNFVGTEFVMYDKVNILLDIWFIKKGEAPADSTEEQANKKGEDIRQELGAVIYTSNVLGLKGPRKMKVLLPEVRPDSTRVDCRPIKHSDSIVERHRVNGDNTKEVVSLSNKSPVWNEDSRSYVLNFQNRVKQASVKNFQIVNQDDGNKFKVHF